MLLRRVGTLRYLLILRENSACQVPICAKHRNSLQKSLCPVVICPYLCSSEQSKETPQNPSPWEISAGRTLAGIHPISLLRISLLRFVDSRLPGNSLWTTGVPPLKIKIMIASNPPKSKVLLRSLAVLAFYCYHNDCHYYYYYYYY